MACQQWRLHVRPICDAVFDINLQFVTVFLRAIAECFARLSHGLGVRPSVRLSVRHTMALNQNGDT